jgi:hypothetical protein
MTPNEINKLPTLQEVVNQILFEEEKLLAKFSAPHLVIQPHNPSAIHVPLVEYNNTINEDKFITVRLSSRDPQRPEKYAFKPNMKKRAFLFRGQSGFYEPCTPSLLRKKEGRFVVENIYYEEFLLALQDHPLIRLFLNGVELNGHLYFFEVNCYGLAQHYGLKTCVIDLTSDIEVAKFFAVTDYNAENGSYSPVLDESRYGVFYYWDNVRDALAFQQNPNGGNLSNIGLQVFPRSGKQRGFLYSVLRDQNFHDCPYIKYKLFRHDANLSKVIFKNARKGKIYFPQDELSSLSQRIRKAKTLSGEAFFRNLHNNPKDDKDKNYAECRHAGINIDFWKSHISFNDIEKDMFRKKIKSGFWQNFCNQIVFPNDTDGKIFKEFLDLPNNPKYKKYFTWK